MKTLDPLKPLLLFSLLLSTVFIGGCVGGDTVRINTDGYSKTTVIVNGEQIMSEGKIL